VSDATRIYRAHPTQEEIDDVLGQRLSAAVGTLNEDGSIHLTYVIFLFEDGRFVFETASVTRKARNAATRSTASFLVQGTASSGRSLMVAAEGSARVIELPAAHAVNRRIRAKYMDPGAIDAIGESWGRFDDVAVEISPVRWRSWTGSELAATTERDLGRDYEGIWLPDA
jgi:nitroimidazol reductase NimA-like FMN-containing flavoprotein (pyridoxamine 5'-phosphate oxidase superfamily)